MFVNSINPDLVFLVNFEPEVNGSDEHTSLLLYGIYYGHKRFYSTGPQSSKLKATLYSPLSSILNLKIKNLNFKIFPIKKQIRPEFLLY